MATNIKYEPGWSLNLTCTNPGKPNSGDPVRIGNLTGIALTDEDAAGKTVVNTGPFVAKFSVKANGGSGIAVGDRSGIMTARPGARQRRRRLLLVSR